MTTPTFPADWPAEWRADADRDPHFAGVHYWADLAGNCLKRVHLPGESDGGADADFGTEYHAGLSRYHGGEEAASVLASLSDTIPPKAFVSVRGLMRRYMAKHAANCFGTLVLNDTQRLYGTLDGGDGQRYPISGGIDRFSWMTREELDALNISRCAGMIADEYLVPGYYLHDDKTKAAKRAGAIAQLQGSAQAPMYEELFHQNFPERASEFRGTFFHLHYRYKEDSEKSPSFVSVFVPPADADAQERLRSLVRDGRERLEHYGPEHCSPSRCYDWNRECPALGWCPRANPVRNDVDNRGALSHTTEGDAP